MKTSIPGPSLDEIVGQSAALKSALQKARSAANSEATVLIIGERGTGKELLARTIHRMGNRRSQSFIKLDCSTVAPSQWEALLFGQDRSRLKAAHLGTLLLKNIESIPEGFRPALLQVCRHRKLERRGHRTTVSIDAIIIASMSDMAQRIEDFWFYKALSDKPNLSIIRVPTLRARRRDIPLLASAFFKKWARRMNKSIDVISTDTMKSLASYDWPGNIQELETLIERFVGVAEGHELRFDNPLQVKKRA
jgi:formate hydrogenlyase transcriptional activator